MRNLRTGHLIRNVVTRALHSSRISPDLGSSNYLWRSFFYVPGNRAKMLSKMANFHQDASTIAYHMPDLIVLDCEDGVAMDQKIEARNTICTSLLSPDGGLFRTFRKQLRRLLVLRMNALDTSYGPDDLNTVMNAAIESATKSGQWPGPDMVCIPKVDHLDDLKWLSDSIDRILNHSGLNYTPSIGMIAMIESCKAINQLPKICEGAIKLKYPLRGIVFGSDDYCVSLGVDRSEDNIELNYPRQYVPVIAKAYGIASIDMVDINFRDIEKLKMNCLHGARLGFNGKQTIHPAQLVTVNSTFLPSSSQMEWSKNLLLEASKHSEGSPIDAGAFSFQGRMIDRPTIKQAQHIDDISQLLNLTVTRN